MLDFVKSFKDLQLDIVGFLAILGEGSVLSSAGVATLSNFIFLPRLLPAPQALLRPTRPTKLEPIGGTVTGVFSGNNRDYVNHVGNVVVDAESMPEFCVRIVRIDRISAGKVKASTNGPLTWVAGLGCVFSLTILVLSVTVFDDGMALLAVLLLSLLSTVIGLGNKWTLHLPKRPVKTGTIPDGDVVIRYPQGSFLVVKCEENVARELYFAPENIRYLIEHPPIYRLISLTGTLMLMFGVIALGNSTKESQMCFAASFILLNAAYWIVAALPSRFHWDKSCFKVKEQRLSTSLDDKYHTDQNNTFTQTLFKVICATKGTAWVKKGSAAPDTPVWDQWLKDALSEVRLQEPSEEDGVVTWPVPAHWDAQAAWNNLNSDLDPEK